MDPQKLWQTTLSEIELAISKASFNTWFKTTCITKRHGPNITIGCANNFTKEWLENKYHKLILKILRGADPEIKFVEYAITVSTTPKLVQRRPTPSSIETIPI